jgi:NAD(P)-dependent dehydrogenase (short-subunit alcohol dehydrogenase family)
MTQGASLESRVALVTGAGRGIGRAHALELATRGAAVVINDLGAELDGRGRDPGPAVAVAEEIRAAGGRAVADASDVASIAGGRAAVEAAVGAFGRIDIIVNNAGFHATGGSVSDPNEADYDAQIDVHLKAALGTTSAGFPHMKRQRWGRVINTVSEVALDARFAGGGAYAAAKAALWSFTLSAAREAALHGVTVNAISPGAATRMSRGVLDADDSATFRAGASRDLHLDPAYVARVVGYLCSDEAGDINGRIIHAAAGQIREYSMTRSARSELARRLIAADSARGATD